MKKIILLLLAAAALGFASCSSSSSSQNVPADPGEAAVYYLEFVKDADFDSFLDGCYFGPSVSESMIKIGKEMMKQGIIEAGGIDDESMAELSKLQIKLVDAHSHGDTDAHVTVEVTNPDGESNQTTFDMKKIEGVWKIVIPM